MRAWYKVMIVIVCVTCIILLVDMTREPVIPVAYTPVQSLDEHASEQLVQQADRVTSPGEDSSEGNVGSVEADQDRIDPAEADGVKEIGEPGDSELGDSEVNDSEVDDSGGDDLSGSGSGVEPSEEAPTEGPDAITSYESILSHAEVQIGALQSSCQGALMNVYFQYVGTEDVAEKKKLIGQGKAELVSCDSSFEGIMSDLESVLAVNDMPTEIIGNYRTEYAKQKALAQSILN